MASWSHPAGETHRGSHLPSVTSCCLLTKFFAREMQKHMVQIGLVHFQIADRTSDSLNSLQDQWQLFDHVVHEAHETIAGRIPGHAWRRSDQYPVSLDGNLAPCSDRVRDKRFDGTIRDDFTVIDDDDSIASRLCLVEMVRRENNAGALLAQLIQHVKDPLSALRINTDRRFIQKQNLRAMQDTTSDIDASLHAPGELTC